MHLWEELSRENNFHFVVQGRRSKGEKSYTGGPHLMQLSLVHILITYGKSSQFCTRMNEYDIMILVSNTLVHCNNYVILQTAKNFL